MNWFSKNVLFTLTYLYIALPYIKSSQKCVSCEMGRKVNFVLRCECQRKWSYQWIFAVVKVSGLFYFIYSFTVRKFCVFMYYIDSYVLLSVSLAEKKSMPHISRFQTMKSVENRLLFFYTKLSSYFLLYIQYSLCNRAYCSPVTFQSWLDLENVLKGTYFLWPLRMNYIQFGLLLRFFVLKEVWLWT